MTQVLDAPKSESTVMAKYQITKEQLTKAVKDCSLIVVNGPDDKKGMALARENRLSLQKMRTTIEAKRKELKADALAYGKKVDAVAKELTAIITPEEQRLKELEETAAREQARLAELEKQAREAEMKRRCELLAKINVMVPEIELQFMDDEAFKAFHAEKKSAFDAARKAEEEAEAARKAETERLEKLAAEQAERQAELDRQQAELEAKRKEIEEAERIKREKCLGWRTSQLSSVNATMPQDEMMALTDEQFDELIVVKRKEDEKRKADEAKAESYRKEQEAKAEAERIAKAAKEEADRIERERLAEIARKEAEAKEVEEEKARIAALAPDREKIDAYLDSVVRIDVPEMSSGETQKLLENVVDDFRESLMRLISKLEGGNV